MSPCCKASDKAESGACRSPWLPAQAQESQPGQTGQQGQDSGQTKQNRAASFTVILDAEPAGNVVVAMSSNNAAEMAQPARFTFPCLPFRENAVALTWPVIR